MLFSTAWGDGLSVTLPPLAIRAPGPRWYIVRCIGGSDRRVIDCLEALAIETYYPIVRELRRLPKKKMSHAQRTSGVVIMRPAEVAFLPRHVFVHLDTRTPRWREMFEIAGVGGFVSMDGRPVSIEEREIRKLKGREIAGVIPGGTPVEKIFELGEEVRIVDGPFTTFNAIISKLPDVPIEQIDPDTRLKLIIAGLLGRSTVVEVTVSQVEKL